MGRVEKYVFSKIFQKILVRLIFIFYLCYITTM